MAKNKIKTNRRAAKTFKITGTGKITHRSSHNGHKALAKSPSQKRRLNLASVVTGKTAKRIKLLLPGKF
jgi:large subunit ribosomal protein L35